MSCTLTVNFLTPGYNNGSDVGSFTVPDGSYKTAYKVVIGPGSTYELRVDGTNGTIVLATYNPGAIEVTIASSSNSCPAPIDAFDCINGSCINKNVYSTPGLYSSLSDCEIACGTGCSGKCVSNADWAQIESLSSQIMNRNCS
ncbi:MULTISPECIES: hypothetical protein [unclassified Nostoc]|uniref:hypothetical protein n=1 Tax=unclassified Nostoc TaxID=2593658 RepID=UPI002612FBFF|nr:hypothetical protein [Nostoc sp. S13]MDF5736799.1 hypothetical protein [Nostoc sp. S13]